MCRATVQLQCACYAGMLSTVSSPINCITRALSHTHVARQHAIHWRIQVKPQIPNPSGVILRMAANSQSDIEYIHHIVLGLDECCCIVL